MDKDEKKLISGYETDRVFREEIEKRLQTDDAFRFAVCREFEKFTGNEMGFKVLRLPRQAIIAWAGRWFDMIDGRLHGSDVFTLKANDLVYLRAVYILAENHCPDTVAVPVSLNGLVNPGVIFEAVPQSTKKLFVFRLGGYRED